MPGVGAAPIPVGLAARLPARAATDVAGQNIWVPWSWWDAELAGVPGGPLSRLLSTADDAKSPGWVRVSRADVFTVASAAGSSADDVLGLFWLVLAWGAGPRLRLCRRRIATVVDDPGRAAALLRQARTSASADPVGAYAALLGPGGRPMLRFLGAAFFTKWLYFVGAGGGDHPCLILDARVAASLRQVDGWEQMRSTGWSPTAYGRYCTLLAAWAERLSVELGRVVRADELELALFDASAKP